MQVDSHFYVTYILCRWAGIDHNKSSKIAYASQYVDDNTMSKLIKFSDESIYKPECTAHPTVDIDQLSSYNGTEVLVPFHFFPDSDHGKVVIFDRNLDLKSLVFGETVPSDIDPYIYLGILLHVIADTYSHQEFYGFRNNYNKVSANTRSVKGLLESTLLKLKTKISSQLPIGHAAAVEMPDIPGLKWSYVRDDKAFIVNNESIYLQAYKSLYSVILFFIKNVFTEHYSREKDLEYIAIMLSVMLEDFSETYRSEQYRCERWQEFIKGDFNQDLQYDKNTWPDSAIVVKEANKWDKLFFKPVFDYIRCEYKDCRLAFTNSDWYKFQKCAKYYKALFKKYNENL